MGKGLDMAGYVILVDKTSPRCDECRLIDPAHAENCSQYSKEEDDRQRLAMYKEWGIA